MKKIVDITDQQEELLALGQQEVAGRVNDVFNLLIPSQAVVAEPRLLTLEGIDGTGKTTLALSLATDLIKAKKQVLILRGSGTTGMDDILKWTNIHYRNHPKRKEILADLTQVQSLQIQYQNEDDPRKKIQIAVQMQLLMFSLQQKYLAEGFYVISDRGILSACLGARDRTQNLEQYAQLFSMFTYLPMGSTIFVDLPVDVALKRVNRKAETATKADLTQKAASYSVAKTKMPQFMQSIDGSQDLQTTVINGDASQRKMLKTAKQFVQKIWN